MSTQRFLAFDIGATSGRAVLATFENGSFSLREMYRFPNAIMELNGKYFWNVFQLYDHFQRALIACVSEGITIDSIAVDTWGVDFGYIAEDGTILSMPRAYRDPYTDGKAEEFFNIIPRDKVYGKTGIQVMDFNSLYQLFAAKQESFAPLSKADKILFIPDLLSYMLTGKMVCEYTDASTSQILNPITKAFDSELLAAAGVSDSLLCDLVEPGTVVGTLRKSIADKIGIGEVPVIAVAGHDTASAVVAVPAEDENFAYLSSGTWSLMGVEVEDAIINDESFKHNFTNEGGIEGTTRFLKNITGMWILEECRKQWSILGKDYSYPTIVEMAQTAQFDSIINPDDPRFANPKNMLAAIEEYCLETNQPVPADDSQVVRCIFYSLANRYKEVLEVLQGMAPFKINKLYVIGGGAQNALLNQITADAIGIPVVAGPSEATAIGNVMIQAKAAGIVADRWEIRKMIANSIDVKIYQPNN